jgi:hypothetical protein
MSAFHCECGYATDDTRFFADHLGWVFDPYDDIGNDGNTHAEIIRENTPVHLCFCGFMAADATEFNDHLLIVMIPLDAIGLDGARHAPLDTTTPPNWYANHPVDQ